MRDLIRDVIRHCTWSCNMDQISVNDKISIKNLKKRKGWVWRNFYMNVKDGLGKDFIDCKAAKANGERWHQLHYDP